RRHTRFSRDWSSDVCSSDLVIFPCNAHSNIYFPDLALEIVSGIYDSDSFSSGHFITNIAISCHSIEFALYSHGNIGTSLKAPARSEERRVGKEGRGRGAQDR